MGVRYIPEVETGSQGNVELMGIDDLPANPGNASWRSHSGHHFVQPVHLPPSQVFAPETHYWFPLLFRPGHAFTFHLDLLYLREPLL